MPHQQPECETIDSRSMGDTWVSQAQLLEAGTVIVAQPAVENNESLLEPHSAAASRR
jgi:hypothetical protein